MTQPLPPATQTAADEAKLGAHTHTFLPRFKKEPQRLDLFDNGVVVEQQDGSLLPIPWNDMLVYEGITSRSSVVSRNYTLCHTDGRSAFLTDWKGAREFGPIINTAVAKVWVPHHLKRVAEGTPWVLVDIAGKPKSKLAISKDGLEAGRNFYPWAKVRSVGAEVGSLYVKVAGKFTPVAYPAVHIYNFHAALLVAKHFHERAQDS
ncbi:hypothetical protein ACIRBX_24710 [Kitasatospora sp. NPDC096147]|uniref:hypothetical protein n=1 Tax=Kitasatospora sp. NPDC096147 TaxID=3364093 RepID=UPI003822EB47